MHRMKLEDVPMSDVRAMYASGMTEYQMARSVGCSRGLMRRAIVAAGLEPISASESQRRLSAQRTPDERLRLARFAHEGRRGKPVSAQHHLRRSRSVESIGRLSRYEQRIFDTLRAMGEAPIAQMAVFKFNFDVGLPSRGLLIECDPGNWHTTPKKIACDSAKDAYALTLGFSVVRVGESVSDVSLRKILDAHPSASRKHRMLWRRYQKLIADERFDDIANVESLAKALDRHEPRPVR